MLQEVYEASTTQKYPLGMRYAKGDRVWRYAKLGATTRVGGYGGVSGGLGLFSVAKPSGALTIVTANKGETTVTISSPTLTVNAYAGGLLTMYEAGQPIVIMGIMSNTETVITLDGKLPGTYSAGVNPNAQVIPSPYHEVVIAGASVSAGAAFDYCAGVLNSPLDENGNEVAAGDFVWIQTWGLCNMWASGTYEGAAGGERQVYVQGDGAAQIAVAAATQLYQRIGCLYPSLGTADVGNNPDPSAGIDATLMNHIIFLQIAP